MLTQIKHNLAKHLEKYLELNAEEIVNLLEIPKNFSHGDLALPVFILSKKLKINPQVLTSELAAKISNDLGLDIDSVTATGGFLNFSISSRVLEENIVELINDPELGRSKSGLNKKLVIDFSSPNVAKKMSIGHLRATVIGQAIYNLAKTQSYTAIGLNHLGDWGTQFGKLAWAIDNWSSDEALNNEPLQTLTELYVRFHDEAEKNPDLEKYGADYFKKLEQGDEHVSNLWKKIVALSLKDYNRLWAMLNVKHDLVIGESFYNDKLEPTVELIKSKGLLVESQGALVVELGEDKPPCLIKKTDGASLYATRDLASAIYRVEELGADLNLYVVGQDQTLHFQQVFEVLKKMGYAWADICHHVSFGMYRFKDIGRMSTRKGNVIHLEDVVNKAIESIRLVIAEKNPDLKDKELIAKQVGIGAIIFNDLVNDRVKNVDFDWERALSFEGDSGPYVQYVGVRCKSILRKFGKELPLKMGSPLSETVERELSIKLLQYNEVLSSAFRNFKPHLLANYLLDVCKLFNQFYHNCRILDQDEPVLNTRILLVRATEKVLVQGLGVLNIECPVEM